MYSSFLSLQFCILAIMYIMMAIGPVCGFLLGAGLLRINTGPQSDGVGLWWGGFVICGVLYLLSSLPFLFFPREANSQETLSDTVTVSDTSSIAKPGSSRSWKGMYEI